MAGDADVIRPMFVDGQHFNSKDQYGHTALRSVPSFEICV